MINKKILLSISASLLFMFVIGLAGASEASVCCQQTISYNNTGSLYCQNVPVSECAPGSLQTPSACSQTSFCKPGYCYDSSQGVCTGNTPKFVCDLKNESWTLTKPASCELGCCILGDQAAFVPLVRCKRLAGFLGVEANFNKQITNEVSCVLSVQGQEKGACVYESEFEKTCKFTTRADCSSGQLENATFFANKLCTAPELGTICGKTKETMCLPGKDEVYFKDSCGNPANIYDSSADKIDNVDYWSNVKSKLESCNSGASNGNSKSCGNCNYLLGSFCRDSKDAGSSANYGDNICADLNCEKTQNGNSYKHGESWCVYEDAGKTGTGDTAVGARFYKHICVNGEEVLEQCADFKQEECIEDKITVSSGSFSQAACRVNRWQDCLTQTEQQDCENTDKRDCLWKPGISLNVNASAGTCVPKNTPGLKFWDSEGDVSSVCAQANAQCIVTFEKGLFGSEKCVSNCDCLGDGWAKQRNDLCMSIGDCGAKINWVGDKGYKTGYNVTISASSGKK